MSCNCETLGEAIEPHPDEEFGRIKSGLRKDALLEDYSIYICKSCNQRWLVEEISRQPLLVKMYEEFDISSFDEVSCRRNIYLYRNGGFSDEICSWSQCDNLAVSGMKICVEHAYPKET